MKGTYVELSAAEKDAGEYARQEGVPYVVVHNREAFHDNYGGYEVMTLAEGEQWLGVHRGIAVRGFFPGDEATDDEAPDAVGNDVVRVVLAIMALAVGASTYTYFTQPWLQLAYLFLEAIVAIYILVQIGRLIPRAWLARLRVPLGRGHRDEEA